MTLTFDPTGNFGFTGNGLLQYPKVWLPHTHYMTSVRVVHVHTLFKCNLVLMYIVHVQLGIDVMICDRVRGNQAFGFEIDFEIRAKNLADGLHQRKCVFHTKVLHDVCRTRLCSLESQNLHAEAARALYTRSCRASP